MDSFYLNCLFTVLLQKRIIAYEACDQPLESAIFRALSGMSDEFSIAHSSISERLKIINHEFFEKIYFHCSKAYRGTGVNSNKEIVRFDSTIISLSTKLIDIGYNLKGGMQKNTVF